MISFFKLSFFSARNLISDNSSNFFEAISKRFKMINRIENSIICILDKSFRLIWKFFPNPIICLDGDESGQKAALRIAERLFPLINEKNKIYFSILPDGIDPDDYIKQNGKDGLLNLLKEKEIIQSFIWNYHLSKIDQNNPYEISKFESK